MSVTTLPALLRARVDARRSERGASAVEYGLLISGIAVVVLAAVIAFGQLIKDDVLGEACGTVTAYVKGDCAE